MVNCSNACAGVTKIDSIEAEDMTKEIFYEKFNKRGQPMVIRNAAKVKLNICISIN